MKIYSKNKKAEFDYFIENKIEAGIILFGYEVKSICESKININDGFIRIKNDEVFLYNVYISPYKFCSEKDIDPLRIRKLLLNKKEIYYIKNIIERKDLNNIIPLQVYKSDSNKIKLTIAVAKGKKDFDKRNNLKENETKLDIDRAVKDFISKYH